MNQQATTKENINKLIEFRQAVYNAGITSRRDAVIDLLDAMISGWPVTSFAMLSQAEPFQRKWPSLYAAIEDGRLNEAWLRKYLAKQVPSSGICIFALDGSPWPRPRARTLDDRQYVFHLERGTAVRAEAVPGAVEQPHLPELPAPAGFCREAAKKTLVQGER